MAKARTHKIEQPGEPEAAPAESTPEAATAPAIDDTSQPEAAAVSEVAVAESPAAAPAPAPAAVAPAIANSVTADAAKTDELNRQVAATAHLVGSDKALDWSHLSNPARLIAVVGVNKPDGDPNAHLPSVESINWANVQGDKILTKQGWLLRP